MTVHRSKEPLSPAWWLAIIVHLVTIVGVVWSMATQYGALRTRLEAVEVIVSRMAQTQEATATALSSLAVTLATTQTILEERTSGAEEAVRANRATLSRMDRRLDQQAATPTKPAKSLRNLIVGK